METLVVNLYGAPCAGKSTGAAYIYAMLKLKGINAELVTEYAKEKVWEENQVAIKNYQYIAATQIYRTAIVNGKVQVIVTDSPIMLANAYADPNDTAFADMNFYAYKQFHNLDIFLLRDKEYNPIGRNENEEQSDAIAEKMLEILKRYNIVPITLEGNRNNYDQIVDYIIMTLKLQERTKNEDNNDPIF